MKKKAIQIIPLILIIAIGILAIRLFVIITPQKAEKADISEGVKIVKEMGEKNVVQTEKKVKKIQDSYNSEKQRQKVAKALQSGNYKYAFKNCVIAGDSTIAAIQVYGILDAKSIVAKVGAGTAFLNDSINTIVKKNPKYLVLHFGENQLGTPNSARYLTDPYLKALKTLKKKLPNTQIYVDSIYPAKTKAYKQNSYLKNISFYNKKLKQMAKEAGVNYLDSESMFLSLKKDYYEPDGIHPKMQFYTEQYLPFVLQEVGAYED